MLTRHLLAMLVMVIGFVLGVILAVDDNWKTGLIVGILIVGAGFVFAIVNMMAAFRKKSHWI